MSEPTLEQVKTLPLEKLYEYALKHLKNLERKKTWNRKYNALPDTKARSHRYYYVKNDIYHPEHNPEGSVEKRFKKT